MAANNPHTEENSGQKITPNLWFDIQAEEASAFYVSLFEHSRIGNIGRYDKAAAEASGQPEGSAMIVEFERAGQKFLALNGGPHFSFNPSISFFVACRIKEEVDELWKKLSDGGTPLMPPDWQVWPWPASTQAIGTYWFEAEASVVLEVPSAVMPYHRNYLVNAYHPHFNELEIEGPDDFPVDPRLVRSGTL